jgi:ribosome maturation factor RimP
MSKIKEELLKVTDLGTKRGEDYQDFLARLMSVIAKMPDADWDSLSKAAQNWYNTAADAKNENAKELPDFPDVEKKEEATTRRRAAAEDDTPASPANLKKGQRVKITNKRGKVFEGEVVELDKEVVVVKGKDGEDEIDLDRIDKIEIFHGTAGQGSEPEEPEIGKGSEVKLVTKRGKEVTGKIVEMDDEIVVLDVDGKEEEFSRDRVETIKLIGGGKPASSGRRASSDDKKKDDEAKPERSKNEPGVSIGASIRELIVDNIDADEVAIGKLLKKQGVEYRENTLKLNYAEAHKLISLLKERKMLKA